MTEATGISQHGLGWFKAPGIWSPEQVEAWKKVTTAVNEKGKGGKFYLQLWHMGRQGHSDIMGVTPPSASATKMSGDVTVKHHKKKPYETAHAMTVEEIQSTVEDYKKAAANALAAGFDGVEIHSANGYLIDQFLQPCTNLRTDDYGGSLDNRLRFLKEVIEAVTSVVPPEKTWVRFSPNGAFGEMGHEKSCETFDAAIQLAASYKLGCIEVMDGLTFGYHEKDVPYDLERVRKNTNIGNPDTENPTAVMGNVGHTLESANKEIGSGNADLISFGRPYMSNPDLPERFAQGIELAPPPEYEDWWTKEGDDGYTTFPRATPEV